MITTKSIIKIIISIIISLFIIGVMLEFVKNDLIIFFSGVIAFIVSWSFLNSNKKAKITFGEKQPTSHSKTIPWWETKGRPYRFIFQHEDDALDAIENAVESHPKVTGVGRDFGNWYTNGETGPEWFSMYVSCKKDDAKEVQNFIESTLKTKGYSCENINYLGEYN